MIIPVIKAEQMKWIAICALSAWKRYSWTITASRSCILTNWRKIRVS